MAYSLLALALGACLISASHSHRGAVKKNFEARSVYQRCVLAEDSLGLLKAFSTAAACQC